MGVNFLIQYPWPRVFQFGTFLSVALSESRCVFAFGLPSSPNFLVPKLLCFLVVQLLICAIFSYLLVEWFRCFGMSCFFCVVLSCLNIFLVFLLGLCPRVVLAVLLSCFFFSPRYVPVFFLCFVILACRRFLICVFSRISRSGVEFLYLFFRGTRVFFLSHSNFAPA